MLPRLAKYFYPLAGYIIGNSQGVAEDLRQVTGLPSNRIRLIYNPVVTPELGEMKDARLEHAWFDPGQPPVILAVGRLKPQKDFSTLIRAFAEVRKKRPCRLLILGEGPERSALEALIQELGLEQDVELPGFLENPCAYMSRASLFVLSSRWEGLPTVLIEALYCGVPIISTDCPSGPREILAGGQYGALVPVQDVSALADAIEGGLSGRIPRPSRESWQPYELETIVDQYVRLLIGQ
jgi:glycosyltransferase involved in cell wall biosynthesis